jgi:hypothetical protein
MWLYLSIMARDTSRTNAMTVESDESNPITSCDSDFGEVISVRRPNANDFVGANIDQMELSVRVLSELESI